MRALCKFRGMLVVMEMQPASDGVGSCPECGGREFDLVQGWAECRGCLFAVLESDLPQPAAPAAGQEDAE